MNCLILTHSAGSSVTVRNVYSEQDPTFRLESQDTITYYHQNIPSYVGNFELLQVLSSDVKTLFVRSLELIGSLWSLIE